MTGKQRRIGLRSIAVGLDRIALLATARTATVKTGSVEETDGDGIAGDPSAIPTLEELQAVTEDLEGPPNAVVTGNGNANVSPSAHVDANANATAGKAVTTASATTGGGQ